MASTDNLVPEEDLRELTELDKQLGVTQKSMFAVFEEAAKIRKALSDASISYKDLTDAINKYNKITNEAAVQNNNLKKNMDERARLQQKILSLETQEGKEIQKLRLELQQKTKATKDDIREQQAQVDSIAAMRAELSRLTAELNKLTVGSDPFNKMKEDVVALTTKLNSAEQSLLNFRRNVGNYASGNTQLSFQVQQLARELPSLTNGLQMYFLAISNNLPMFVDELNKAKAANVALNEEGKKGIPIWRQLIGSIFSFQTLLVVAITVITLFGKEIQQWISGLINANKQIDMSKKMHQELSEEIENTSGEFGKNLVSLKKLQDEWNSLGNSLSSKKKYIEENKDEFEKLGVQVNTVFDAENLLVKNTEPFIESMKLRAQASAAFNLAQKEYEKMLQARVKGEQVTPENVKLPWYAYLDDAFLLYRANSDSERMAHLREVYANKEKEASKKVENAAKAAGDAYFEIGEKDTQASKAILKNANIKEATGKKIKASIDKEKDVYGELVLFRIQQEAEAQKRILEKNKKEYEERIKALGKYMDKEVEAIRQSEKNQLSDSKLTTSQRQLIHEKAEAEIIKAMYEGEKLREGITKDYAEKQSKVIENMYKGRQAAISEAESKELEALAVMYGNETINHEQYSEQKTQIALKYSDERMNAEIDNLETLLAVTGITAEEREKIEEQLQTALAKYEKEASNLRIKEIERIAAKRKEDQDKEKKEQEHLQKELARIRKEAVKESVELLNTLFEANTQRRLDELDTISKANEKQAEIDTKRVDDLEKAGAISKEQADARKELIDQQQIQREEQLEQKRKAILERQARFEKVTQIANIISNTAVAIMKQLTTIPFPMVAPLINLIAATGAIQLATVMAQPIPKYAKGTENHEGGLAWLGDGGKRELAIFPSGEAIISPSHSTLYDLPEGTMVLPDYMSLAKEALRIRKQPETQANIGFDDRKLIAAFEKTNEKLDKLIVNACKTRANSIYAMKMAKLTQQINNRKSNG